MKKTSFQSIVLGFLLETVIILRSKWTVIRKDKELKGFCADSAVFTFTHVLL